MLKSLNPHPESSLSYVAKGNTALCNSFFSYGHYSTNIMAGKRALFCLSLLLHHHHNIMFSTHSFSLDKFTTRSVSQYSTHYMEFCPWLLSIMIFTCCATRQFTVEQAEVDVLHFLNIIIIHKTYIITIRLTWIRQFWHVGLAWCALCGALFPVSKLFKKCVISYFKRE